MYPISFITFLLICSSLAKHTPSAKAVVLDVRPVDLQMDESDAFSFSNLDQRKALMLTVQYSTHLSKISEFEVTMTNQQKNIVKCHFQYSNNLCVIEKPTKELNIQIKCLQNKCSMELSASQRIVVRIKDNNFKRNLGLVGEIYHLQKEKMNSIVQVYSERGQQKVQSHQIQVYSNVHTFHLETEQLNTNSAIFGLKPIKKDNEQYICIEHRSKKSQRLKVSIRSHSQKLTPEVTLIDFIENYGKHSHSSFSYTRKASQNVQVELRVFKPIDLQQIPLTLLVRGLTKKGQQIKVREFNIRANSIANKWFDYSFALTDSLLKLYSTIYLDLSMKELQNKTLFFEIKASSVDAFHIDIFDQVYFGSKADEQLYFMIEPQVKLELADGDKQIYLIGQGFTPNTTTCSLNDGCVISVSNQKECFNCTFSFSLPNQDIKNYVLYYLVKNGTIQGKIDMQEQLYFKYLMAANSSIQVVVNTIDVIIYANLQSYQRCVQPVAACHQYMINKDNPIMIRNDQAQEMPLVIGIIGLERTSFKVRFLNRQTVPTLKLGERFSYLMDNQQGNLDLRFALLPKQVVKIQHLHFNLISPIHSLKLTVVNEGGQSLDSLQGYISLDKMHIKSQVFKVRIQKINDYVDDFVHFTLIVTSNELGVKLDSNTHYEKYASHQTKKFYIQYDSSRTNAINIYTQNLEKSNASMQLTLKDSKQTDAKVIYSHSLKKDHEFINIDDQLDQQDICDEDNCELELAITNSGQEVLQQAINLLTEETVIQLDDSIWSTFQINDLSVQNHFYFIPRNANKSITILFTTDQASLYITYRFFNTSISINPIDWPFVHSDSQSIQHIPNSQEISIDANDTQFQECWPTCVILINLNIDKQRQSSKERSLIQTYKLLATNSIIELPQDTKLQFTLANDEEKVVFILAKNILTEEKLTFFTYYSLGRAKIKASLVSQDKQFKLNKGHDFIFKDLQTILSTQVISSLIYQQNLKAQSVYIKISILAITSLKMTIEYSSRLKGIYQLRMEDTETIALNKEQTIWYQFAPEKDFVVKLYRIRGSALFKVVKCSWKDYVTCLNQNKEWINVEKDKFLQQKKESEQQINENLNKQIKINNYYKGNEVQAFIYKSYEFKDYACPDCIYYIWIYCYDAQLLLTANLRTSNSQIQLKEMTQYSDNIQFSSARRYLINVLYDRDTTITVRIIQGSAEVVILDNTQKLLSSVIHGDKNNEKQFVLKKELEYKLEQEDEQGGADKQYVLRRIYVTVTALTLTQVQYIISYSIGPSSLYLEDGVMVQRNVQPQVVQTFYFRNSNKKQSAHLTISSQILHGYEHLNNQNQMLVSFFYYPDASNLSKRQIFKPEIPPTRNGKYFGRAITNVYNLPAKYQLYQIKIQSKAFLKVTISVSHQQMMFLLLDLEYPVKLGPNQVIDMAISNPQTEFLQLKINKCDMSLPTIQYTNDVRSFKINLFDGQMVVRQNSIKQFIKTKKDSSTLHLRLLGRSHEQSMFTITAIASTNEQRLSANNYKAGNEGLMKFTILKGSNVEVVFKGAVCFKEPCNAVFTYQLVFSSDIDAINSQLNCAGSFFANQKKDSSARTVVALTERNLDKKTNQYRYIFKLEAQKTYVGVKGVTQNYQYQIRYIPLQIQSIWGKLSNFSWRWLAMGALGAVLVLLLIVFGTTRLARRGYKPIEADG